MRPLGVNATYPTYGIFSGVSIPVSISVSRFPVAPVVLMDLDLQVILTTAPTGQPTWILLHIT